MKFLLTIITFSSIFAQSLSAKPLKSIETNDSENNSQIIDEVVIESIDKNVLDNILFTYNPTGNDLDQQFQNIFIDFYKSQNKFNDKLTSLVKEDGFKDVMINRFMPLIKTGFGIIWNNFVLVLDRIFSSVNEMFEQFFNRSLPITYYKSAKLGARQIGSYLCQQAMASIFYMSAEKAVHHCSTIFSSINI